MLYAFHKPLLLSLHISDKKSLLYSLYYIKRNKREIGLIYYLQKVFYDELLCNRDLIMQSTKGL